MPTPPTEPEYIQLLRKHYQSIQRLAGDERLRRMLSAERIVTKMDRQMDAEAKALMLAALDQLESQLLTHQNPKLSL